jgi:hypothetical protein
MSESDFQYLHRVLEFKYRVVGDIAMPYANEQYLDVVDESLAELERLTKKLKRYRELLLEGYTVEQIKFEMAMSWIKDAPIHVFHMDSKRNPRLANCVYFCPSPLDPGVVKIGYTDHLATRIKSIDRQLFRLQRKQYKIRNTPVLFIQAHKTKAKIDANQLESAFHLVLSNYCIRGEWFDAPSIRDWLKSVFTLQTDKINEVFGDE